VRQAKTFSRKMNRWRLLAENAEPHLQSLPQLDPLVGELRALIAKGEELDGRQEIARGVLMALIHERQDLERGGEALRTRLANHLRGAFGAASNELIQFGISPRKPRGPNKKKAGDAGPPG
jgi:hypothetical protein